MTDHIQQLIAMALAEDMGPGDITSLALVDEDRTAVAKIRAKEPVVLAGMDIACRVFHAIDAGIIFEEKKSDGNRCRKGEVIAVVSGRARSLLAGERTALNFLQHLSGIATLTATFVKAAKTRKTKILDTRKTLPGYRAIEKHAVRMGGGTNHRMGLYDHFLIKNNHIAVAGSITKAISSAMAARKSGQMIEVETRTMREVREAVTAGADVIMLDNMSPAQVRTAVKIAKGKAKFEVSGNVSQKNIRAYARTGVDYISVGALTHSAPAADIHMLIDIKM